MTRSTFLLLPDDLQDRVIEGLDRGELTMQAASDLIARAGHSLSYEAVANYYKAVRRERRRFEISDNISRYLEETKGTPTEELSRAFVNLTLASATQAMADGDLGFKDLDLIRLMTLHPVAAKEAKDEARERESRPDAPAGLSDDQADLIKRKILGIEK